MGKLDPNTPYHRWGDTEKDPKCSAPCFTSDEFLLKCKGHLRSGVVPVLKYLGRWGNWGPNSQNDKHGYTKSNPKCSTPCFKLKKASL